MFLLRIAAAVAFVFGILAAEGWGFVESVPRATAFVAFGLLCWVVSTFPSPPLGPPT